MVIVLFILSAPFILLYVLNNGNPITKYMVHRYIPAYLENQGYTKDDMQNAHYVEPKYIINKDYYHGHYMVIFKDEPEITYYYGLSKRGKKVKQFCEKDELLPNGVTDINEESTKHSEQDCVFSLENR